MPRYDLLKKHRYVNKTFVQTSRGCHRAAPSAPNRWMNGLKFRYARSTEVIHEMENCGSRTISINDADFFARRTSQGSDARVEGRASSGRPASPPSSRRTTACSNSRPKALPMLSIGFESISRSTLQSVHKHVNRPETFGRLVEKVHSYGIMVFGLFMFASTATIRRFSTILSTSMSRRASTPAPFRAHTLPRHSDLVRNEAGEPHRLVRLDDVDQGHVRLSPGNRLEGDELRSSRPRYTEILFDRSDRQPLPLARPNAIARNGRSTMPSCAGRRALENIDRSRLRLAARNGRCRRSCRSSANGARRCSRPRKGPGAH